MKEQDIIRWLRERAIPASHVPLGIGDDAAILTVAGDDQIVMTTDLLLEGTHFTAEAPPHDLGWKALAVSVSDVAAMGCRAMFATLAVGLRRDLGWDFASSVLTGAERLAREYDVALVGGDTTESRGGVVLCSTVLGAPESPSAPIRRSGARPGEVVLVTGSLGGSLLGGHLTFRPRQREALQAVLEGPPSSMIDISDGLSTDAAHLARESQVAIVLEADLIPVSDQTVGDRRQRLGHALHDGEDFELLFTAPADVAERIASSGLAGTAVTRIGRVLEGDGEVRLLMDDGEEILDVGGYEHFG